MNLFGGVTLPGEPDLENVRRLDLLPVNMVRKMQRLGIAIDVPYLQDFSAELGREMAGLEKEIAGYIPLDALHRFSDQAAEIEDAQGVASLNANSAVQIRALLFDLLKVGRGRDLKTTANGEISTGKKQLELCRDDHPVVHKVLQYRERSKLKSAFADALPKRAKRHPGGDCPVCELRHVEATWRVHTEFTMTRTETGRFASKNPNLQQIPARSELGRRIRQAFLASPGTRLVSTDFSQIELRDLAHSAQARSMIEVYERDGDIHEYTAMRAFDIKDAAQVDKIKHRLPCKTVNFGIVYGMQAQGLQAQLAVMGLFWTEEQSSDFIERWFNLYPEVGAYMELQYYRARRYGYVWDVFGRVRRVPETRSCHPYIRSAGLRQAGNMPIQSASAGQTKLVMGELDEDISNIYADGKGIWAWPLLTIHDQLVVEVEEAAADDVRDIMQDRFNRVMIDKETGENLWRVPVKSDGEILTRWKKE